jgi:hypothetical protein
VNDLSPKEQDLLKRVEDKPDLRPLFFRKVKGLKWFNSLFMSGYFDPKNIPSPTPSEEEGYVSIPSWLAIEYLVKTVKEINESENLEYAEKFLDILMSATAYAKQKEISNYRTWWQFSEVISKIPSSKLQTKHIDMIDYWLDDKYDRNLVISEIGEKWLPEILREQDRNGERDQHGKLLSKRGMEILYKVIFVDDPLEGSKKQAILRFDAYHAKKITEKLAFLSGEKLGKDAIRIFEKQLILILEGTKKDLWSSLWQPAIEDHEQNKHRNDAANILIQAYRDSLEGYLKYHSDEAIEWVAQMLDSEYEVIKRIAINSITKNYPLLDHLTDELVTDKYIKSNFQHELWHFYNKHYKSFAKNQKATVLSSIDGVSRKDDDGNIHPGATAYKKATWLAAIKEFGPEESELYDKNTEIAKSEPEHPDFSSYMTSGSVVNKSPKSVEELQALSIEPLIKELSEFKGGSGFDEPNVEGLSKTLRQLVKVEPLQIYLNLDKFVELDLSYIYEIIEAFRELWAEKSQLPWDEVWEKLLEFIDAIISRDSFWSVEEKNKGGVFLANQRWIVGSIARLIESGTKSDDHAFNKLYLDKAEALLVTLLKKEVGAEFSETSDAVSIAINSSRGQCIEALINLTLRSCRIADKENDKDHSKVWAKFQEYFEAELSRSGVDNSDYEFITLVTNYLPNFLYMSKEWVTQNLSKIFDQKNYLKWLCAIQGYSYVSTVNPMIYSHLKDSGDYFVALDDENLEERVKERCIEDIAITRIHNPEDNLIKDLLIRNKHSEISYLIWFLWTLREDNNDNLKDLIFELWPDISKNIDFSSREGKKLASILSQWSVFFKEINSENIELLFMVAPYAGVAHHSPIMLESIANLSKNQPREAQQVWMKMLEGSASDYPEEAIREAFTNILSLNDEGLRMVKEIESEYIKRGNDRPTLWLREIIKDRDA